ncbi:TPA: hypothetical protein DCE37_16015 [Candidatus Latescibacteria bacterium]|nr:hypothetical protein [Candidatus Latescibacterota bacterium]
MLLAERVIDLLSNRVYKKVAILSSALFVVATVWVLEYAEARYEEDLEDRVAELAVVGANQTARLYLDAVAKGRVTLSVLLSEE